MFFRHLAFFGLFLISLANPGIAIGATISGTLAFDGAPTSESFVNIWDEGGNHVAWAGNDGNGNWISHELDTGTYYATAWGEDFGHITELYNDRACPWEACDVTQGDPIIIDDYNVDIPDIAFDLAPEERLWRLRGSVHGPAGQTVGGVVRLYNVRGWHMGDMWTDHLGNFESETLADGTYFAATAHTDGILDEAWNDVPCDNQLCDLHVDATPIIIDGSDINDLNFVLEPITSGGHIGGQVSGPDGPLANVWMEIHNANGDVFDGFPTDADGNYRTALLADGDYFIHTQNAPLGLGREMWDDIPCDPDGMCWDADFTRDHGTAIEVSGTDRLEINFDLVLPPGGMISGQLIDAGTMLPVTGGGMALINANNGDFVKGTHAAGNGNYYFSGLAPGIYKVLAEGPPEGYTPALYGGDTWPCNLDTCGDEINIANETSVVSGIDIHLDYEGTRIVGQITRSDTGQPVDGSQGWVGIDLFNANGDHMGGGGANEAGLYDIRLEGSGEYYLVATNDIERHHLVNEVWHDIPCIFDCYPLNVPGATLQAVAEGETFLAHIELDPGYRISGTLAFEGAPTPESFVNIWDKDGHNVVEVGNDGGNWISPALPPGTYYATARGEDFGLVSELYDDRACPWEACDVTLGDPIVLVDSDATGIAFDLAPEERLWRLRGSVHNSAGQPVGGAVRLFNIVGWSMGEMWTDHLGNFESDVLADGTYFAATVHTGNMLDEAWDDVPCVNRLCNLTQDATPIIVDGADIDGLNFVLEPITSGGHISGQVRGPDGPLANVWMEVHNAKGEYLDGWPTDADGYYRTHLLANGTYFVNTQNEPQGLGRELWDDVPCDPFWLCWDAQFIKDHGTAIEISGTDRMDIDFDLAVPPGGIINGQLIDAGTGLPVMGGWMVLINAETHEFQWGTSAAGNGEYYFSGLEPGNYKVLAEGLPEGYRPELYGGDHWPCNLDVCGDVITIASETSVAPGKDIYLDHEGTRIVGRITRGDTGDPVNGLQGWVGVDLFNANGDHMGGAGANEAGLYDIRLEGSGEYYLVASNDIEQHHLVNEVWFNIPCLIACYPWNVQGASLITVAEGNTFLANFELTPRDPPIIERRARIHPTATIGDFSVIEENVIVNEYANLGVGVQVVKNAEIGAFCNIRHFVQIGQNTVLGPECHVGYRTFIDKGVVIGARVVIGPRSWIGKDVRIGDDAVIGRRVELGKSVIVWPGVCIPDDTVIPKDGRVDTNLCH